MNISGVVRIDLSGYVEFGDLVVGDRAVYELRDAFRADPAGRRFRVNIGAAHRVARLDERLLELLAVAEHVEFEGTSPDVLDVAVRDLRVALDERILGPRSAS